MLQGHSLNSIYNKICFTDQLSFLKSKAKRKKLAVKFSIENGGLKLSQKTGLKIITTLNLLKVYKR